MGAALKDFSAEFCKLALEGATMHMIGVLKTVISQSPRIVFCIVAPICAGSKTTILTSPVLETRLRVELLKLKAAEIDAMMVNVKSKMLPFLQSIPESETTQISIPCIDNLVESRCFPVPILLAPWMAKMLYYLGKALAHQNDWVKFDEKYDAKTMSSGRNFVVEYHVSKEQYLTIVQQLDKARHPQASEVVPEMFIPLCDNVLQAIIVALEDEMRKAIFKLSEDIAKATGHCSKEADLRKHVEQNNIEGLKELSSLPANDALLKLHTRAFVLLTCNRMLGEMLKRDPSAAPAALKVVVEKLIKLRKQIRITIGAMMAIDAYMTKDAGPRAKAVEKYHSGCKMWEGYSPIAPLIDVLAKHGK
jgi:hypothetical protein